MGSGGGGTRELPESECKGNAEVKFNSAGIWSLSRMSDLDIIFWIETEFCGTNARYQAPRDSLGPIVPDCKVCHLLGHSLPRGKGKLCSWP